MRVPPQRNRQHPKGGVETQCEVGRAHLAKPEMFSPPHFPPAAIERRFGVARQSFREEQLAFAQGTEGNRAGWVGAFLEHGLGPIFSSAEFWPESFAHIARQRPKR